MRETLLILLFLTITICHVSCQVGDEKQQLFFEYLRPYWRQHKGRIRPFVAIDPAPIWRIARSANSNEFGVITCTYINATETLMCIKYTFSTTLFF